MFSMLQGKEKVLEGHLSLQSALISIFLNIHCPALSGQVQGLGRREEVKNGRSGSQFSLKMSWFPIPEQRKCRKVSDVVSLRCLLVTHSDKGDSIVGNLASNSLEDPEDSVAGLAVLPVPVDGEVILRLKSCLKLLACQVVDLDPRAGDPGLHQGHQHHQAHQHHLLVVCHFVSCRSESSNKSLVVLDLRSSTSTP